MKERPFTLQSITGGAATIAPLLRAAGLFDEGLTYEVATMRARTIVAGYAKGVLFRLLHDALERAFEDFKIIHGEYEDQNNPTDKDEWDLAADDMVESVLIDYEAGLTATFVALNTVETKMYEKDAVERIAAEFADCAWQVMTHEFEGLGNARKGVEMTSAKLIAACGISAPDFRSLLGDEQPSTEEEPMANPMATTRHPMETLNKIYEHFSGLIDPGELEPHIENALDSDMGLALSGITQLGGDMADVENLAKLNKTPSEICDLLLDCPHEVPEYAVVEESFLPPGLPPLPSGKPLPALPGAKPTLPPLPGTTALPALPGPHSEAVKKTRSRANDAPVDGQVPKEAMNTLREHVKLKDEDLGAMLGVSRMTFQNYASGKAKFVPTDAQKSTLVALLDENVTKLQYARKLIEDA